jgi:hypothetical protein
MPLDFSRNCLCPECLRDQIEARVGAAIAAHDGRLQEARPACAESDGGKRSLTAERSTLGKCWPRIFREVSALFIIVPSSLKRCRSPRRQRVESGSQAMISFFCPYCKMPLKADASQANHLMECVQCKLEVRVPAPPAAQAAPSASTTHRQAARHESWWRRLVR